MSGPKEFPHDLIAEKSLLGCLLIDGAAFDEIIDVGVLKDDFFHPQYGFIFEAVYELAIKSEPIDYVSICSKLTDMGKLEVVGGSAAILELSESVGTVANIHHYAKTVKDKSVVREILRTCQKMMAKGLDFTGSVADYINEVESSFFKLTSQTKLGGLTDIKAVLRENLAEIEKQANADGPTGIMTGFKKLDEKLLGLQPGQLVIIAARPAMGKTSFVLNIAVNSVKESGLPIAFFSLEMLAPELSGRILASEAGIDAKLLRTKNFQPQDMQKLMRAVQTVSNLPIKINDEGDINLLDIKSQCRKLKAEQGLGVVVIDYLQLMGSHTKATNPVERTTEISRGLKNLAKELGCPVIALSQLNRSAASRENKRPMLNDLRDSGSIEQDADVVLLIHREEYYNPETPDKGIGEIIVAKNRAGEPGTVKLAWIANQTKFANLGYDYED